VATIGIRELKAQATALVARAENGEAIVVSRRGRPVAVMLPLEMDVEALLWAQSSGLAERRARALEGLARGEFIAESDIDAALEARGRRRIGTVLAQPSAKSSSSFSRGETSAKT
jgi:prevent-host-death family protein